MTWEAKKHALCSSNARMKDLTLSIFPITLTQSRMTLHLEMLDTLYLMKVFSTNAKSAELQNAKLLVIQLSKCTYEFIMCLVSRPNSTFQAHLERQQHVSRWPETKSPPYKASPRLKYLLLPETLFQVNTKCIRRGGEDISRPLVETVAPLIKMPQNEK